MDKGEKWWDAIKATITPLSMFKRHKKVVVPLSEITTLDLHGMTVQEAYMATVDFINSRTQNTITIITGKSGQICQEFPEWMNLNRHVRSWEELNGGGAFRIILLRGSRTK